MIPKIIHYVWVGNKEKSELVLKCIESWKKFCPDFEIIEWGNDKVSKINNLYVQQAFENKKWAFVSDYLRLYALNNYGGIYVDTDLEITNKLDEFLDLEFFTGFENFKGKYSPITAIMGAEANNKIISDLLKEYDDISFIENGSFNLTTNTSRITKYFIKNFNYKKTYNPDKEFILNNYSKIYPSYYFCTPKNNEKNYSIHHFNGSWTDSYSRKQLFAIKNYKIIRFHKRKTAKDNKFPLIKGEKILYKFRILNYTICIIK